MGVTKSVEKEPFFWTMRGLEAELGLKKSAIHARIVAGLLPSGVKDGEKSSLYPVHEVKLVRDARISGLTDDEIRALVRKLHDARAERAAKLRAELAAGATVGA